MAILYNKILSAKYLKSTCTVISKTSAVIKCGIFRCNESKFPLSTLVSCNPWYTITLSGCPRHRKFRCSFFQTGKTQNLPKNIKNIILHGEYNSNTGKLLKFQKLKCGGMQLQFLDFLMQNGEFGNNGNFCSRLHCICDGSLVAISLGKVK